MACSVTGIFKRNWEEIQWLNNKNWNRQKKSFVSSITKKMFFGRGNFSGFAGVPVYLAPWTAACNYWSVADNSKHHTTKFSLYGRGGKINWPRRESCPGISYPRPGYLHPRGASCPGQFILPPAHTEKILLCDVYYYLQHFNNYMQFLSYKYVNLRWLLQTFSWVSYWQGVGGKLSRAVYLSPCPEFQRE